MKLFIRLAAAALVLGSLVVTADAQQLFWDVDTNGNPGAGGGTTPSGTWDTGITPRWNVNSDGSGVPGVWTDNSDAVFAAGSSATGSYTVTLGGTVTANSISFEEGTVAITGGTELDLTGAATIDVAATSATIGSIMGGSALVTKNNSGILNLTGANTFSGGFNLNAGTVRVNSATALGAANATVNIADSTTLSTTSSTANTLTYAFTNTGAAFTLGQAIGGTGVVTMDGTFDLGGSAPTITLNNAADTISAVVSNGGITKAGTGTLTLSGVNTYAGQTNVSTGILSVSGASNASPLGTSAGNTVVADGASLQIAVTGTTAIAEPLNITGTGTTGSNGALFKSSSGTTTMSSQITLAGNTLIAATAGTLQLGAVGTQNANFISGVGNNLTIGGTAAVNVGGGINLGTGTFTKDGTNTVTFNVNQGSSNSTFGALVVKQGSLVLSGTNFTINMGTNPITVNSGAVLETSSSTKISLSSGAVYTLNNGTLRTTNAGAAGSFIDVDAVVVLNGGGTFDYNVANVLNIMATTTPALANTALGITGTGPLTKTGQGVLALASQATYTGDTIVNGGELRLRGATNRLPTTTNLIVNSPGILNVNGSGQNQTVASLSGTGRVGLANGTLTVDGATSTVFTGTVEDTANYPSGTFPGSTTIGGKIVKQGTGTLTLTGTNLYTGGTTISAGTVLVNNATGSGTGTGAITVATNGTVGGTGTIGGAITNNGTISPGDGGVGTLSVTGNVTDAASAIWHIELNGATADKLGVAGNIDLSASDSLSVTGTGSGTSWVIGSYTGTLAGTFDTVTSGYTVNYGTGTNSVITLSAVSAGLAGDFNSDGKVDAADYPIWRKNDTANAALPNDGGAGTQAARYALWRTNFGKPSAGSGGGLGSSASVPEPTTLGLFAMGLFAVAFGRHRKS